MSLNISGVSGDTVTPLVLARTGLPSPLRAAEAGGVVDHVGLAVDLADHHHHVTGDVDQVADLQLAHDSQALGAAVRFVERDAVERRADRLVAGVARQLHAHAAVDLGDEAAAVAAVVVVAPTVALAEERKACAIRLRVLSAR